MLKVRFAPSPTGYLHIGGARTCLFNWLYVRKLGGKFVLRIEDTDVERSKTEYLEEILESIKWLGMDWDQIHYQSQRFDIYREYAQKLIDEGKAYKKDGAVFFKYTFSEIKINDLVRGEIMFNELPKEEEVIIKSDNSPTYNFSCVIDDALMEINCVIRGEDHISNTPKQILMYEGLGFKVPEFAHLPLILSPSGGRMSKRFGATSIREYKQDGYLSQAIVNYLLLLGWAPGDNREIISLDEAKNIFDIKKVNKAGAAFCMDKLNWVNSEYIKNKNIKDLTQDVINYLQSKEFLPQDIDSNYVQKVVELFQGRMVKLSDLLDWGRFCFYDDYAYSEETKDILDKNLSKEVSVLMEKFSSMDSFDKDAIEKEFRNAAQGLGLKTRDLVHPVRVALTGRKVGPGLFETIEVLGRQEVVKRLKRLCEYWEN
ncbi:MAG: glutamate--tRNA ligase [Candidatus Omnitrophota bacterium]|nr:glutamate--tRNA ligase [Candidatus Omnitrophota bacterium]